MAANGRKKIKCSEQKVQTQSREITKTQDLLLISQDSDRQEVNEGKHNMPWAIMFENLKCHCMCGTQVLTPAWVLGIWVYWG